MIVNLTLSLKRRDKRCFRKHYLASFITGREHSLLFTPCRLHLYFSQFSQLASFTHELNCLGPAALLISLINSCSKRMFSQCFLNVRKQVWNFYLALVCTMLILCNHEFSGTQNCGNGLTPPPVDDPALQFEHRRSVWAHHDLHLNLRKKPSVR